MENEDYPGLSRELIKVKLNDMTDSAAWSTTSYRMGIVDFSDKQKDKPKTRFQDFSQGSLLRVKYQIKNFGKKYQEETCVMIVVPEGAYNDDEEVLAMNIDHGAFWVNCENDCEYEIIEVIRET